MTQGIRVRAVAKHRAEDDEICNRANAPRAQVPGRPFAEQRTDERHRRAPDDHLECGAHIGAGLGRMALGVDRAERPGGTRDRERDRPALVGRQDFGRCCADEEQRAQETEQEAGDDAPVQVTLTAGDDRVEQRRPHGDRDDEDAGDSGPDVLLRPDHERVAAGEKQQPHDGEGAPVAFLRQRIAEGARKDEEDESRDEEAEAGKQERRQLRYADFDR